MSRCRNRPIRQTSSRKKPAIKAGFYIFNIFCSGAYNDLQKPLGGYFLAMM